MREREELEGYTVTSQTQVIIEVRNLPPGTSALKVELMVLTWALELRPGRI